jgi:hypothetical protein
MNCALPCTPPQKVSDDMPMIRESGLQVITSRIATRMDPRIWASSASKFASESIRGCFDVHAADAEAMWQIFKAVVAGGDTYVFAPDTPRQQALDYYLGANMQSWVAEEDGVVVERRRM